MQYNHIHRSCISANKTPMTDPEHAPVTIISNGRETLAILLCVPHGNKIMTQDGSGKVCVY